MSLVTDQVRSLDLQLDRLHFDNLSYRYEVSSQHSTAAATTAAALDTPQTHRTQKLQKAIAALSVTSHTPAKRTAILKQLQDVEFTTPAEWESVEAHTTSDDDAFERELEWVLVGKAAVQTYGILLDRLVSQTVPLSEDLFYWDEVLSSQKYTALYSLQTSPKRLWDLGWEVYEDALQKFRDLRLTESLAQTMDGNGDAEMEMEEGEEGATTASSAKKQVKLVKEGLSETFKKFFALVQSSLRERSLLELNKRSISPFAAVRHDIKVKQASIRKLKEMQASGLGVLINEGLSFESEEDQEDWKGVLERSIILMENVANNVTDVDQTIEQFEDAVFSGPMLADAESEKGSTGPKEGSSELTIDTTAHHAKKYGTSTPCGLSMKLQYILSRGLPAQRSASQRITYTHGKPGIITRYWLPATAILLSSGTILRILVRRKAEIKVWIQDLGATIYDFWMNWVVDPTRKIIGTIRHDQDSEVALLSRRSLVADMDSLERMVVEFAVDNPATSVPDANETTASVSKLNDAQVSLVRERVKEGDLTPVLKVYEKELKSPVRSAIRGELVRALLIQIQKTKVDVEVAVSGIDSILKSQELVFGFLGLTPGVLICVGTFRWMRGMWGGRKGIKSGKVKGEMLRTLRNIDRILATSQANRMASPTSPDHNTGMLTFKEHGLLLCEVHVLRGMAKRVMPTAIMAEFVEDLHDVSNIKNGVDAQSKAVERVKWAYSQWIH